MRMTTLIRTASAAAFLACSALFFTGCQDVIYSKIMNEVQLDDATISGTVNSIVRYGDNIFIENGTIYYKSASSTSHDTWTKYMTGLTALSYDYYGKTWDGTEIIKVAADENNLYALGVEYSEDTDDGYNVVSAEKLYYSTGPGSTWTLIKSVTVKTSTLFCTNAVKPANRYAFIRMDGKVYYLNGQNEPTELTAQSDTFTNASGTSIAVSGADSSSLSAVWYNGSGNDGSTNAGVYVFNYLASASYEPTTSSAFMYYVNGSAIYYTSDGSTWSSADPSITSVISMAVTSDSILLGTSGSGIYKVSNSSGTPGSSTVSFSTNADSALSSPYRIISMLSIKATDTETGGVIYAAADFSGTASSSSGDYDDIGLWSYYPTRGNWNRE